MIINPRFLARFGLFCVAAASLCACTGNELRQSMGMKRNNPDEFQVVSRPPLSVPPVYHLRPPSEEPIGHTPADVRAEALVLEGRELPRYQRPEDREYMAETAVAPVEANALGTQAESVLLQNAGAAQANPHIRTVLREEAPQLLPTKQEERSFMDKLKRGWFVKDDGDPVVDAGPEQARIREAKAADRPLNEGETPVIDPKDKGVFDSLFN